MKWVVSLFAIFFWLASEAQNTSKKPSLNYRLMVEQETAYDFDLEDLQKSEWTIDSEASFKFSNKLKVFGQLRLYSELTDRLEPGYPDFSNYSDFSKPLQLGKRGQLELRELYADFTLGKTYWRVGKQQAVWGEMDGLKILDVLNPMNLREFILDDFEDSRIPLWAIKGDIKAGKWNIQPYWSPDITSHQFPSNEGLYAPDFSMADLPPEIKLEVLELQRPGRFIRDSDVGVQISTMVKGWDMAFNYVYQYDKAPVIERSFDHTTNTLTVLPTLKRQHVIGGSFGKTQGLFGLRTEIAFFPNKHLMTSDPNDPDGLYSVKQTLSGIAVDYFGISDAILTFQWFADIIEEVPNEKRLARGRMTNTTTFMLTKYLMNQRVELEAFAGYRFDEKAGFLDLKTSYMLKDNLKIWVGGDLFTGKGHGLIGSFTNRDRVSIGMQWGLQSKKN
jgi:hypothetical protein